MFNSRFKTPVIIWALPLAMVFFFASCTDLDESVNSEVTGENFFQNDQEFISALGDAYNVMSIWGSHGGFASIQEVSSDEIVIPQRGQDWFDGGIWLRTHRHTFNFDEGPINGAWQDLFRGVNNANRLIFQFQSQVEAGNVSEADAASFISELKVLRAFYYFWLLDTFGNVPIITSFEDAPENPSQPSGNFAAGRQAVFDFVEQEITSNIDQLNDDVSSTYGRVNQFVAHFILAKLYMNAEVYTGTARWSDALTQLDAIIDSGNYSLTARYRDNFVTDNSGSSEIIFAVPYDKVFLTGFNIHQMSLHYGMQSTFQLDSQPWNGYATLEEFYLSYTDPNENPGPQGTVFAADGSETTGTVDARLVNFLVGPQTDTQGNRITDDAATDRDPDGPPLTLTPAINELEPGALRQAGARVGKFEIELGALPNLSNDFPVFRYADVLLMKGEALWRQGNSAQALTYINMIRNRAGVDNFTTLSADKILAERGREMFYEIWRRQDLIRFDSNSGNATRFNDSWEFKDASDDFRIVFPIPRDQLEANGNLVQNPGYQG